MTTKELLNFFNYLEGRGFLRDDLQCDPEHQVETYLNDVCNSDKPTETQRVSPNLPSGNLWVNNLLNLWVSEMFEYIELMKDNNRPITTLIDYCESIQYILIQICTTQMVKKIQPIDVYYYTTLLFNTIKVLHEGNNSELERILNVFSDALKSDFCKE